MVNSQEVDEEINVVFTSYKRKCHLITVHRGLTSSGGNKQSQIEVFKKEWLIHINQENKFKIEQKTR